jgi:hypothetical protein
MKSSSPHRILTVIFVFLLGSTACTSLKKGVASSVELNATNNTAIHGTYNAQPDKTYILTLADFLEVDYFLKYLNEPGFDSLRVKITPLDEKHIEVSVFNHDTLQSVKVIKGKYKQNYFVLKKQHNYEPELGIFLYSWTRQKTRIRLSEKGNIIVDSKSYLNGFILGFVPVFFVSDRNCDVEFERLVP